MIAVWPGRSMSAIRPPSVSGPMVELPLHVGAGVVNMGMVLQLRIDGCARGHALSRHIGVNRNAPSL